MAIINTCKVLVNQNMMKMFEEENIFFRGRSMIVCISDGSIYIGWIIQKLSNVVLNNDTLRRSEHRKLKLVMSFICVHERDKRTPTQSTRCNTTICWCSSSSR